MTAQPNASPAATGRNDDATPPPNRQRIGHALALAALCGLLYFAAARLGLSLRMPDLGASALWPPNALLLAALLLSARRYWWLVLLATLPAHFAAHFDTGQPVWRLSWQIGHNWILTVCTACILRRLIGARSPFETLRDISIYLSIAVFAAPAVIALLAPTVGLSLLADGTTIDWTAWLAWRSTYLSNAIAFLTLSPAIVLWASKSPEWLRRIEPLRYAEAALIALAIFFVFVFVFQFFGRSHSAAALYALLGPLLWAAARFGVGGAASALFVIALISTVFALEGRSPFLPAATVEDLFGLQMFLLAIALPVLILAVLIDERVRRAEAIRASAAALRESEERYRAIVESQTELVCRYLSDTTLTFVNSAYCRYFGRSREELIGGKFLDLIPQASWNEVRRHIDSLARLNHVVTYEHEVLLPDGSTGWQQWVDHVIYAADGTIAEYQAIGRDITELKRVEESLRQSDERFRLVLRATNDVIFDWNIGADTLWWSANGDTFFGPALDGGRRRLAWWSERIHPDDRRRVMIDLQTAIDGGEEFWEMEYRLVRSDGGVMHVNQRGFIVHNANGRPLRMIGSLMDITDRKRLEEANRALARVSHLAAVGAITASIAHEINQPLGAILNNAEAATLMLESSTASPDEMKQILDDIRKDDLRAGDVIRRLRALLQNNELQREALDLNEVVAEVVKLVKSEANRRRVVVTTDFSTLPPVHGDRVHLQQVLLNLILNGMDALADTPEPMRRVTIRTRQARRTAVEICVSDAGSGIAAERLPRLFDSFYTSKANGMGLGLSIVRSIVEAHGGRVWAENNKEGPGASFRFEVPIGRKGAGATTPQRYASGETKGAPQSLH